MCYAIEPSIGPGNPDERLSVVHFSRRQFHRYLPLKRNSRYSAFKVRLACVEFEEQSGDMLRRGPNRSENFIPLP